MEERSAILYIEYAKITRKGNTILVTSRDSEDEVQYSLYCCIVSGPGTSITHSALQLLSQYNVGYAITNSNMSHMIMMSHQPTATTDYVAKQLEIATSPAKTLQLAKRLYSMRFDDDVSSVHTTRELLGKEGYSMRKLYRKLSDETGVPWERRNSLNRNSITQYEKVNSAITMFNSVLYCVVECCMHSMGICPVIGVTHKGSALPLVYDVADVFKEEFCVRPAFEMVGNDPEIDIDFKDITERFCKMSDERELPKMVSRLLLEMYGDND